MKHIYVVDCGIIPAVADLTQVDEATWEVNRVNVPAQSRGLGHGKRLLRQVTAAADAEQMTLVLNINPYGPLNWEALAAWYKRNGFDFTYATEIYEHEMIRQPQEV